MAHRWRVIRSKTKHPSRTCLPWVLALTTTAALFAGTVLARKAALPADPRSIPVEAQLSSTKTRADLDGDGVPETLLLVNTLTGEEQPERASEVVLAIISPAADGSRGELVWSRHVMAETGRPAHDGELAAIDLDGDGGAELILSWDRSMSATRVDRWAEIYAVDDPGRPRRVWEGPWLRDTRRDPATPVAEREWFQCEIEYGATRKAKGREIVLREIYKMIGGVVLPAPKSSLRKVGVRLRPLS